MFWLSRPPYLQWAATIGIIVIIVWLEIRPAATVMHPFVAEDVPAGAPVEEVVALRSIPDGVLAPVEVTGYAARALEAGAPLLPGDIVSEPAAVPDGWWALALDLPPGTLAGSPIQLVVIPGPGEPGVDPLPGVVVVAPVDGGVFGESAPGLAAFAPEHAASAAVAIANREAQVLVGSPH